MKNCDTTINSDNLKEVYTSHNKKTWISPKVNKWETDQITLGGGPKNDGGIGTYGDG
ncbi:hypothetical protein [Aquirufa ecclesiirivi]|uniref:hypothetical protein n=1 Tax=Aquirufa ecclesiirivi TaxID=2715124 RepID=UPI0023D7B7E4|nr:hypothetical protein [Aquirufa ecclesiirivi]MDF0694713.1 hypothetical protein [Aquirufa ecclesiirivi]